MATAPVSNQGKGKFLRAFLEGHRDARRADATAAWQAEGHDDGISESLFSQIRSELGLTKKTGSNGRAAPATAGIGAKGKAKSGGPKAGAKTVEDDASQPDMPEGDEGPSKSSFVSGLLGREPGANLSRVNEAWASAGHGDKISPSIFYKVKRERGVSGESSPAHSPSEPPRSGPKPTPTTERAASPHEAASASAPAQREPATARPTPTTPDRVEGHGRELHEIEGEIDEIMFRLKGLGNFAEVQEALRAARRLLVRSHGH